MKIICVVGTRPNFMKMAPVIRALEAEGVDPLTVHTGQHYDQNMSKVFFDELGMPSPDVSLGIGSGTHAQQTAGIMVAFEKVCESQEPGLILVAGDVNSTLACALVAAKKDIPVGHVEAGLRSFDRTMPEEVNRVLTDHLCDLLFTTEESGNANLRAEGIASDRVHFVGNCMVDSLVKHVEEARKLEPWSDLGLEPDKYVLVTLHRPSNVDHLSTLRGLVSTLSRIGEDLPVVFPMHPRTRARLAQSDVQFPDTITILEPMPYLTFLGLLSRAAIVLTDSGGIQEETTTLGIPCLTARDNTERPVTINSGTNHLVGTDESVILEAVAAILRGDWPKGSRPDLWDGMAAQRISKVVMEWTDGAATVPGSSLP